jgi:type I restriction enzyme R subunit
MIATATKAKAKVYLEKRDGVTIPTFKINLNIAQLLQDFIPKGGFDVE